MKLWEDWFDKQSREDKDRMAKVAIERLMESEEISFRIDDSVVTDNDPIPEDEVVEECLYWSSCGEDIRDD